MYVRAGEVACKRLRNQGKCQRCINGAQRESHRNIRMNTVYIPQDPGIKRVDETFRMRSEARLSFLL